MKYEKNKFRTAQVELRKENGSDNIYKRAALSSDVVLNRGWYTEQLVHTVDAVNLERAVDGLPLLYEHNRESIIGRVTNVRVAKDKKLRGDIQFSQNDMAVRVKADIDAGFLSSISIGYRATETLEVEGGIRLEKWDLFEASIVSVPADITAGINRSISKNEDSQMNEEERNNIRNAALVEAADNEKLRRQEVRSIFKGLRSDSYDTIMQSALDDPKQTPDLVRTSLLAAISASAETSQAMSGIVTVDETDKFRTGVMNALEVKANCCRDEKVKSEIRSNEFHSFSMTDIARECLRRAGVKLITGSRSSIIGQAMIMNRGAHVHGVVDFPGILANVSNKSMQLGYEEAPETWRTWCKVGNISDFKLAERPQLSAFNELAVVADKADYTSGAFSDISESIQLATFGKLFDISRKALINDDISGLSSIPAAMGKAAGRTMGTLAYNILIANAAMDQDAVAVFSAATHNNLVTSAGIIIDPADIDALLLAMALQQDPAGEATLGLFPGFMLVPTSLAGEMRVQMEAKYEPGTAPGNLQPNKHQGLAQVVSEHRLEAASPLRYYSVASNNVSETVEVAFLDGIDSPTLLEDDPFTRDGVTMKVRIDAGARALEFRGMQRVDLLGALAFDEKSKEDKEAMRADLIKQRQDREKEQKKPITKSKE